MRPFPHSSQGVHTYRNHAEIYRTPRRHVREIIWGQKPTGGTLNKGPTSDRRLLGGIGSQSYITGLASNKTNCSATRRRRWATETSSCRLQDLLVLLSVDNRNDPICWTPCSAFPCGCTRNGAPRRAGHGWYDTDHGNSARPSSVRHAAAGPFRLGQHRDLGAGLLCEHGTLDAGF
jgi:hypothetical protein